MELILIYVLILALFAILPTVLDICLAYWSLYRTRRLLIDKASVDKLTLGELRALAKEIGKAPPGIPALTRGSIALTVVVALGIAVFHLLVKSDVGDNSQIIGNVLSMLGGLLAAITGFYFGGKAAEKKAEEGEEETEEIKKIVTREVAKSKR
jgi:hypothetical protein